MLEETPEKGWRFVQLHQYRIDDLSQLYCSAHQRVPTRRAFPTVVVLSARHPGPTVRRVGKRSSPARRLGFRVVRRRGLLDIEGPAVGGGLNPNRCIQRTVLRAVSRRRRYLIGELLDQLESRARFSIARDRVGRHGFTVLVDGPAMPFH